MKRVRYIYIEREGEREREEVSIPVRSLYIWCNTCDLTPLAMCPHRFMNARLMA